MSTPAGDAGTDGAHADVVVHVGDAVVARIAAERARRVPGVVALRADLGQALLGLAGSVLHRDPRSRSSWPPGSATTAATWPRPGRSRWPTRCAPAPGLDAVVRVVVSEVLLDRDQARGCRTQSPHRPPPGARWNRQQLRRR